MIKKDLLKVLSGVMILTAVSVGGVAIAGGKTKTTTTNLKPQLNITKQIKDFGQPGLGFRGGHGGFGKLKLDNPVVIQTALDNLVTKGALTQEKAKEVQAYLAKLEAERKAEFEKIKKMTVEEAAKYLAAKKGDITMKVGPCSELVTAKILTQEQADALANQIRENKKAEVKQKITDDLTSLVTKGTITQEQASKIITKLEAVEKEQQATMDKLKNMTPEERLKYMQENSKKSFTNPIDALITEGVITAEQSKAITAIIPNFGHMGGKMMMHFGKQGPRGAMASQGKVMPQGMSFQGL